MFKGYDIIVSSGASRDVPGLGYQVNDALPISGYDGTPAPIIGQAGTVYIYRSFPIGIYRQFPVYGPRGFPRG